MRIMVPLLALAVLLGLPASLFIFRGSPPYTAAKNPVKISQTERHHVIMTVIGEAGRQPRLGKIAVIHVILNRGRHGGFGGHNLKKVVTHKRRKRKASGRVVTVFEFEPWMHAHRRRYMRGLDRSGGKYRKVADLVDGCLEGRIKDPTDGALYFLNISVVKKRRRGQKYSLPKFARNKPFVVIADHTFFGG